ncbi:succinylglutamate desuccinylase/aspartoacylase family protein [Marinobacter orientalis]|uniref:Succinylglutamate desuccinylase/aspartoacylase family protein n=1 Tax=Marinobacter orientalis TaxID=1928859 RepID=A0A7Y0R9K9_9GAMM|nr:succinylglutamate desuccinylase/aspartoacylase family protein [Marinobacter orientalis]NMT62640.1 succinylglutamate desuccinylase/aspartoacylase family protein [Marinobacter orientalis]TGX51329.1 succinylglutamate desuccinylase/aspartoacylase family protein [Marinobacter orientalis]
MLYRWLTPLFRAGLISTLCGSLVVLPTAYAEQSAGSDKQEVLMAELVGDENVEDVAQSEPLQLLKPQEPSAPVKEPSFPLKEPSASIKEPSASVEKPPAEVQEPSVGATVPSEQPAPREEASSLTLLGSEVPPGTATRLSWSPAIQGAGLSQPTPVLVVNGARPGPTLCLTGAVHGDELNGIEIIRRTIYDLEPAKLSGRVIGVPIVNLPGFQQGSRYLPDRRDLNRHFPGSPDGNLADRIAHSLFENVIRHCDMLVDIHTGSLKRTNLPQLRADMNNPDVAELTRGFDRMAVVHSTGSKGMLRFAAIDAGICAVTMEAGESLRIQEHQIKAGVNSLTSLMDKEGMISRMFVWGDPEPVYYDSEWVRAEHGGILFSETRLGDKVDKGEILGYVSDPITNAQHRIRASSNGRVIGMAVDQVVMAGFAAYHVGTEAEVPAE